jgi:hypothetical protein
MRFAEFLFVFKCSLYPFAFVYCLYCTLCRTCVGQVCSDPMHQPWRPLCLSLSSDMRIWFCWCASPWSFYKKGSTITCEFAGDVPAFSHLGPRTPSDQLASNGMPSRNVHFEDLPRMRSWWLNAWPNWWLREMLCTCRLGKCFYGNFCGALCLWCGFVVLQMICVWTGLSLRGTALRSTPRKN